MGDSPTPDTTDALGVLFWGISPALGCSLMSWALSGWVTGWGQTRFVGKGWVGARKGEQLQALCPCGWGRMNNWMPQTSPNLILNNLVNCIPSGFCCC